MAEEHELAKKLTHAENPGGVGQSGPASAGPERAGENPGDAQK